MKRAFGSSEKAGIKSESRLGGEASFVRESALRKSVKGDGRAL